MTEENREALMSGMFSYSASFELGQEHMTPHSWTLYSVGISLPFVTWGMICSWQAQIFVTFFWEEAFS